MKTYVVLMRGINVGGKNKVPMITLKSCLEELGFKDVLTYIQSGNVILRSDLDAQAISKKIEDILPKKFKLDSAIIRVVAIEDKIYQKIVTDAPHEFGKDSISYRYNVIFLINISASIAMTQISAREGVDDVWEGKNVLYFRNSIPNATKSRLGKIAAQPMYKSITIRNWNTTLNLSNLLLKYESDV